MRTYLEELKIDTAEAIREAIAWNHWTLAEIWENCDEIEEKLNDDLFVDDSVTGNASGSYYCNSYKAQEMVQANIKDVLTAIVEYGYSAQELGEMVLNEEWEKLDVITRCYYVGEAIADVLGWLCSCYSQIEGMDEETGADDALVMYIDSEYVA